MLLKHHVKICDIDSTQLFDDPVMKEKLSKISPYTIYIQNKELIESFSTALVNYSPISINIVDFWNKEILDTTAYIPPEMPETKVKIIQPFEFAEPENPPFVDPEYGEGFLNFSELGTPYGGALLDLKKSFEYNTDARVCPDEFEERFFINSLIGVQDRLAQINLNNFYSTLERSINDVMIYERMKTVLEDYGKDTHLFNNTNELFTEDKFLANRDFVTKKGTALGIKYAGRNAHDAQIQGTESFYGDYFMNVYEDAPFKYHVESNLLDIVFEKFVKPLAHPIGMDYTYSNICDDPTASETEFPIITYNYRDLSVYVDCLCYIQNLDDELLEDQPFPSEPNKVTCVYNTNPNDYPEKKVFATPDGTGLWKPIQGDGNICYDVTHGIENDNTNKYYGKRYEKFHFCTISNPNVTTRYLIKYYITDSVYNTSERIDILYYKLDGTSGEFKVHAEFINQRHCNVKFSESPQKVSSVDEDIDGYCEDTHNGIFQYLCVPEDVDYPNNIPIDAPTTLCEGSTGWFHDGYMGTEWGGVLGRWTDIYFGWFRFCDKGEDCLDKDAYGEDGLVSGFDQSFISMSLFAQENGVKKEYVMGDDDVPVDLQETQRQAREKFNQTELYKYLDYYEKEINGY